MALTFEQGDCDRPRGHAILYFRDAADTSRCLATYLVVLPIAMDVAKYIPPLLAGRLPLGEAKPVGALPLPPIPEVADSREALYALAEQRADDVLYGGTLVAHDLPALMHAVSEAAQEYHERYERALARATRAEAAAAGEDAPGELDVQSALYALMSEADRIAELTRLTGQLRYALQGPHEPLVAQAVAELERLGRHLHPKYRFASFLAAARMPGPKGDRLTHLYITRCYRICHHEYDALAALDAEIQALESGEETAST